jgi:hypothetical protein
MRVSLIEEKEEATRELNTWFLQTLNPRAAARAYMNPCHTSPCYNVRAPDRYSSPLQVLGPPSVLTASSVKIKEQHKNRQFKRNQHACPILNSQRQQ